MALAGITKVAATAGKIPTPWSILGKADANNRLRSENETQTFRAEESYGAKWDGNTREGRVTELAGCLPAGFKETVWRHLSS